MKFTLRFEEWMYEMMRQEAWHSKDLIQEVLSVETAGFHPLDIVGEILQCMLIKMYFCILCWYFIEVCKENSTSAASETALDLEGINKIRFECLKGAEERRIKSIRTAWEEASWSGTDLSLYGTGSFLLQSRSSDGPFHQPLSLS